MSIETRFDIPLVVGLAPREKQGKDYDVIACIAWRGFKVRREDMRYLLQATNGKVFTLTTMGLLTEHTRIREYRMGEMDPERLMDVKLAEAVQWPGL